MPTREIDKRTAGLSRDGALLCPNCGGENLHHEAVIANFRTAEDHAGYRRSIARNHETMTLPLAADSHLFEGRRDDVVIHFWCEECSGPDAPDETETPEDIAASRRRYLLHIVQHKGRTFVFWSSRNFTIPDESAL